MKINVIIKFKAKPEKLDSFRALLKAVKSDLPREHGCHRVLVFSDTKNFNNFTLVESWESELAHKKHIDTVVANGAWDTIVSHLECDPESGYYAEI